MNKIIAGILCVLVLSVATPVAVSALSIADIQSQIKELLAKIEVLQLEIKRITMATSTPPIATPPPAQDRPFCRQSFYRSISYGIAGDDVRSLQELLHDENILDATPTGFFGSATHEAIIKWQQNNGIEGTGYVGPKTRELIKRRCGGEHIGCTKEYKPVCGAKPIVCITTPCNPIQQTYSNRCMMKADGASFVHEDKCHKDTKCLSRPSCLDTEPRCLLPEPASGWCPASNKPPTISGFSGPTTLAIGASGTWKISASDPENGTLSYSITWGDEYPTTKASAQSATMIEAFVQTTTFTHSYNTAGVYTVTIIVRDNFGQEARTSATVKIGTDTTVCTQEYAPVCGRPQGCGNTCKPGMYCTMLCQMQEPKTYSNKCNLEAGGAAFLYDGVCKA